MEALDRPGSPSIEAMHSFAELTVYLYASINQSMFYCMSVHTKVILDTHAHTHTKKKYATSDPLWSPHVGHVNLGTPREEVMRRLHQ